jgi:hypothetical protein
MTLSLALSSTLNFATIFIRVLDVPGSNLGQENGGIVLFSWFSQCLWKNVVTLPESIPRRFLTLSKNLLSAVLYYQVYHIKCLSLLSIIILLCSWYLLFKASINEPTLSILFGS